MKIIGRVLIILVAFLVLAGLMATAVNIVGNAIGKNDSASLLRPAGEGGNVRPEREEHGVNASGLIFGAIRNVVVIGFFVTAIVLPKSMAKKKRKQAND